MSRDGHRRARATHRSSHVSAVLRPGDLAPLPRRAGMLSVVDVLEPSHVLTAMGLLSSGSLRVSLHRGTTEQDVDRLLEALPRVAAEQRQG